MERIFLNPNVRSNALATGNVRVVLWWLQNPRDLDLHCCDSKGNQVCFMNKKAGTMQLDVDVTSGLGPETITVDVEAGTGIVSLLFN